MKKSKARKENKTKGRRKTVDPGDPRVPPTKKDIAV